MTEQRANILDFDRAGLEQEFEAMGERSYRVQQVMKWIYHRNITDFAQMTDLSKKLRETLAARFEVRAPEILESLTSIDGTRKWRVKASDGNSIETVLIPERGRNTLCVSSQVGCVLDCKFCSTGKQGFHSNLSTAEIIGQVLRVDQLLRDEGDEDWRGVTNVVLMGMGEPLLNFDAVIRATNLMMDDLAFGISKRRVTISTAGVVPGIYKMAECTDVSLAISLHAPTDALRDELVPVNRRYPIAELLAAVNHYLDAIGDKRSVTLEYTLLKGVNDSLEHARALAQLVRDVRCKINLIPFNPFPHSGYERPAEKQVRAFQTLLMQRGFATMLRTTRGEDIDAACGQLVGKVNDRTRRSERYQQQYAQMQGNEGRIPVLQVQGS